MNRKHETKRGIALIWTIIFFMMFVGFVGIATDFGLGAYAVHQLQNAADSAALAGAAKLRVSQDEARTAAYNAAIANTVYGTSITLDLNVANAPDGDIVLGRFDRETQTWEPTTEAPNAVLVNARKTAASANGALSTTFGGIWGTSEVDVERDAIAINQGGTGGGLIALCPDCECALHVQGNPTLDVDGGAIQVDSSHSCAACGTGGSAEVIAPSMDVVGGLCPAGVTWPEDIDLDSPYVPDPLAFLPEPVWLGQPNLGAITGSGTYQPGYYEGGLDIGGNANVTLEPGIYMMNGAGFQTQGTVTLTGNGVMIYITPGTGFVDIGGGGVITMTPPDPDLHSFPEVGTYEGVTIFQSRTNENESEIIGSGSLNLEGTLYFPHNHLQLGGTGAGFGNQLIAWTVEIFGTGDITIHYTGSFPAPGDTVFLVR